ncbi:hypothetical protein NC652_009427 [Populus alba x Populus x berolinensis]|nr:hypothetical protein NC652_009427 [Populus alba x Populus x berolinensis]
MTGTPQETETQQVPPPPPSPKADQEAEFHEPTSSATVTEESHPKDHPPASDEKTKKWGTHIMGPPAAPNFHPDNQQAALWNASEHQQIPEHPYLVYTPIDKSEKSTQKSFEPVIHKFQEWGKMAETVARNIWHNLSTGPSVPQAAWGKVNLTVKAMTEGGFESLFKHIFETTDPNEKLKKSFACYLSTSTGPVAGTLYLSTARVAFCSDRPLCHTAPSGEEAWSYYKMTGTPQEAETQHVPPPPPKADQEAEFHEPTSSATVTEESHPNGHQPASDENPKKWGTHIMGPAAAPNVHPDNQQAALWNASEHQQIPEHPYLVYTPIDKSEMSTQKSFEPVIHKFQEWGKKAETVARNMWHNRPSVPKAAWGKVNLTAKAITEGGFESLFKHIFETDPNEKLKKTFACYLSTSTGPVAGTLYLSTARVAFCSDRPLCHTAPSGEEAWSYYKLMIPLDKISTVSSETMLENPSRKYIQIVSTDGHDFWFMGFVNFEKALQNLSESVSSFKEAGIAIQPIFENGVAFGYVF